MASLLDDADVLLNASSIDNMPLSLIEAQAAGLPVVSTRSGGIPWIILDGQNGLLVAPDDDEAMARASLRLLGDPELVSRITQAARASCLANYSWRAAESGWLRSYRSMTLVRQQ